MASDFTWPKPYLLQLYARAVEEGCLRIKLRGADLADRDKEFNSFKGAFLRLRRRKDGNFLVQMRAEYQMVMVKYERETGRVLLTFDALPDGEVLPEIESVDGKTKLEQPRGVVPHETPEEAAEDFDATKLVEGLINNLDLEEGEGGASDL